MPSFFEKQPKLGILGGGQLGRMLIQSAINFDLYTKVLDSDDQCPCRDVCSEFVRGSITDYETVLRFGKDVDVLTIEIENVNVDALEQLQSNGITV
ncbi:MAG TPA: 5-(carboxyamino)imidazole ribonucleotide synthase, partial [Bacteroidota bacterium]|nr:5-(carboxyamino)imidazole ribonucleotide synthase [Bacteroidota bacterium]